MVKHKWKLVALLLLSWMMSRCVDPIDFTTGPPPQLLVVDGRITTNNELQYLYLSQLSAYGSQVRVPVTGALITLFEGDDQQYHYQPSAVEPGRYELGGVQGRVGNTYYIEIRIPDERIFRSEPETMQAVPSADSLSFSIAREELQSPSGTVLDKWFFNVAVNATLNPQPTGPYLRWEVETAFSFTEKWVHPLQLPMTCYIQAPFEPYRVLLFDGSGVQNTQPIKIDLARKRIDWVFTQRHFFSVYQSSLTESAYQYWSEINKISDQVGNIFDIPPAAVRGNIYNIADEEEVVLGYFGASAIDTVRQFTLGATMPREVAPAMLPLCGGFDFGRSIPRECTSCLLFENSTYQRPAYFDE